MEQTIEQPRTRPGREAPRSPTPGLVLIFSAGRPCLPCLPLDGDRLELGRGEVGGPSSIAGIDVASSFSGSGPSEEAVE